MNRLWKVAIPFACLVLLCGSVALWPLDQDAAANQKKFAQDAKQAAPGFGRSSGTELAGCQQARGPSRQLVLRLY